MSEFYAELDTKHGGPGYVRVIAEERELAMNICFKYFADDWWGLYSKVADIPKDYRNDLGEIREFVKNRNQK